MSAIQSLIGGASAISFVSLLHMDGANNSTTFTDVAGLTWTRPSVFSQDAKITTAQSKWGGAAGSFDPSTFQAAVIECSGGSSLDIGTGDFCIEGWIYQTTTTGNRCFVAAGASNSLTGYRADLSGGVLRFFWYPNSNSTPLISGSTFLAVNTWHFVQIRRSGNTFTIAANGTQDGTATNSSTQSLGSSLTHYGDYDTGGGVFSGSEEFSGYLDEFRISKQARTINLPTGPFPDT